MIVVNLLTEDELHHEIAKRELEQRRMGGDWSQKMEDLEEELKILWGERERRRGRA